jgi:hypothetical protein
MAIPSLKEATFLVAFAVMAGEELLHILPKYSARNE